MQKSDIYSTKELHNTDNKLQYSQISGTIEGKKSGVTRFFLLQIECFKLNIESIGLQIIPDSQHPLLI